MNSLETDAEGDSKRQTRFKEIRQLGEDGSIAGCAINEYKEEVAFRCELIVKDGVEVVSELIVETLINPFNKDAPSEPWGKLIVGPESENQCVLAVSPKEVVEVDIKRELGKEVGINGETGVPTGFLLTYAKTVG